MDTRTLGDAMGWALTEARYAELLPAYLRLMQWANINTVERAAMLAAQLGHESVGLKYQQEIHDGSNYEGRRDLGNIYPGDGRRFRGHGWIQVTGRGNHTAVSKWAHDKGLVPTPTFFVDYPERLGDDTYCWVGPAWYWTVARPQINSLADRRDLDGVTRAINGGLNGLADRRRRYNLALGMGNRLLPPGGTVAEKVLNYPRDQVHQDTFYNCGPASVQTVLRAATGEFVAESVLGRELGTHTGGTDWIGQVRRVLNARMPGGGFAVVEMPNDPPTRAQKDALWVHVTRSIDAGFGVVANIVAPPSNYPRAVAPSTISPAYSGGTVYHYIAVMGYSDGGGRRYWIADSGFPPFGYWISHDQLASLIPPKGYSYSTAQPEETDMGFNDEDRRLLREVHRELTQKYPSRSAYRRHDKPVDSLAGMILNVDARVHEDWIHARAAEEGTTPDEFARRLNGAK